ncbi:hypothetical protein RJ55_07601 [Drechmeria coniospora]|nr:hypothetical protein RJ55_07601 [Drechmeria coniospora]
MFGGGSSSSGPKTDSESTPEGKSPSPDSSPDATSPTAVDNTDLVAGREKRSGNGSPPGQADNGCSSDKKRRSSGVGSKASSLLASARNSLNFGQASRGSSDLGAQTPLQKLGRQDSALVVPQGQQNNSAGESVPGPKSTFRVGVWEDRNKKCRRTMEDTHAFLYNFLDTPAASVGTSEKNKPCRDKAEASARDVVQSDNGYFAIFDGHAGTFAADWCGKKLHIILEEMIKKHPTVALPELLDQTFTTVDAQLEKLPLKNSGCTAAVAVLRWEERVPGDRSGTASVPSASPATEAAKAATKADDKSPDAHSSDKGKEPLTDASDDAEKRPSGTLHASSKGSTNRRRVLYTANVGDARIILCRSGKALRLSYDHKGSDENEGRRIANAGGLILNNRVNGVLAVTRALGDAYMKELVTGHPYTTETVVQPDFDEFIIIACDGLWDVCSDQEAVDLVRNVQDPTSASKLLVDHALSRFSTDNLSCMIVRFDKEAAAKRLNAKPGGSESAACAKLSEVEKIVQDTKQKIADGSTPAVGVSASNNGRGYDIVASDEGSFVPTTLDGTVEEEPVVGKEDDGSKAPFLAEKEAM